ncbi:MAG: hypothetical protein LW832_01300 [Parachlamydia sp.]|jgi:hypothetical protein|nr:hypothetical protein [Parachlamydia sp.]
MIHAIKGFLLSSFLVALLFAPASSLDARGGGGHGGHGGRSFGGGGFSGGHVGHGNWGGGGYHGGNWNHGWRGNDWHGGNWNRGYGVGLYGSSYPYYSNYYSPYSISGCVHFPERTFAQLPDVIGQLIK